MSLAILFHFLCAQHVSDINPLTPNDLYMSYRTTNLQMLHFIYLFNKCRHWIF